MLGLFHFILILCLIIISGMAGFFIAGRAKEELGPGRKHFLLAQRIILILSAGIIALTLPRTYIILAYLFLAATLILIRKELYAYMILGGGLAATGGTAYFPYVVALVIIYFLTGAALFSHYAIEEKQPWKKMIGRVGIVYALFLGAAILGYLL